MNFSKLLPHVAVYFILMMAAFFYFKPIVFEGKSLPESDNVQARGMQAECHKYEKLENRNINWTDQVFMGMPTYQIYGNYNSNLVKQFCEAVFMFKMPVNTPHVMLFYMMFFAYLGLLAFGVDKWISLIGALSFGFATNNLVLFEAGHSTKLHAMVYMAPILAGTYMAFKGRIFVGSAIVAFCLAAQLGANHLQITYYTFLMMGFLALAFLIHSFIDKKILTFFKASGLLAIAAILGVLSNLSLLWTTYEYSSETIRGGTELKTFVLEKSDLEDLSKKGFSPEDVLKINQFGITDRSIKTEKQFLNYVTAAIGPEKTKQYKNDILTLSSTASNKGLDKGYIFDWSYGILETFTLIVPNFYGGSNSKYFADDASKSGIQIGETNSAKALENMMRNADPQQRENIFQELFQLTSQYWGAQPFTSGPVYLGAVICLLFILGLLMVKGPVKWGLGLVAIFFVVLSWGDNFKVFNYFMVDHFPMYNKFRAVTMALGAVQIIAVIMAMLGLSAFINHKEEDALAGKNNGLFLELLLSKIGVKASRTNYLYIATGITLTFVLYALMYGYTGDMTGANDGRLIDLASKSPFGAEFYNAIKEDRANLIVNESIRSLVYILLAAGTLWIYASGKIKQTIFVIASIGILTAVDLISEDLEYVNEESFERKESVVFTPEATPADLQVMDDKTLHFRVYDLMAGMRSPKKQRGAPFQNSEAAFFHKIIGGYHAAKPITIQEVNEIYFNRNQPDETMLKILGMMNVKYILMEPSRPMINDMAMGNAWFVDSIKYVNTAEEEISSLETLIPWIEVVTRKNNSNYLNGFKNKNDSGDFIKLTSYHPEKLVYNSITANERFAVFSEIYYPPHKGWNVYLDGKLVKEGFIKVNYLLRGMRIPAGKHTIEMKFEPKSYSLGETSALISSLVILILFGIIGWISFNKIRNIKANSENNNLNINPKKTSK